VNTAPTIRDLHDRPPIFATLAWTAAPKVGVFGRPGSWKDAAGPNRGEIVRPRRVRTIPIRLPECPWVREAKPCNVRFRSLLPMCFVPVSHVGSGHRLGVRSARRSWRLMCQPGMRRACLSARATRRPQLAEADVRASKRSSGYGPEAAARLVRGIPHMRRGFLLNQSKTFLSGMA
jgi:hypothetical protein